MTSKANIKALLTTTQLLLVVVVALFVALGVNGWISTQLVAALPPVGIPTNLEPSANGDEAEGEVVPESALLYNRNLFAMITDEPAPAELILGPNGDGTAPVVEVPASSDAPAESSLPLELLGTMVSSEAQWSVAHLRQTSKQEDLYAHVGDGVEGATLIAIHRTLVLVQNPDGKVESITLGGKAAGNSVASARGSVQHAVGRGGAGNVSRKSGRGLRPIGTTPFIRVDDSMVQAGEREGSFLIDKEVAKTQAEFTGKLAEGMGLAEQLENGDNLGFRIGSIAPGSLFEKVGMQGGDIILSVDGQRPETKEQAAGFVTDLAMEGEVIVEIDRRGERRQVKLQTK
ncbi:MAG: hypothetical protein AUK47_02195 [Deltaproteobacteria bacterium CG2_30_63_29]|nr:MAG: hypothetical protein AUK47_02195 [Deltaproteobacteria bacterium CG2_30_63_29]PJB40591.1 MAG: hypothetical protein CO108_14450 [Deltaproteobacteria bacterium CG_4_9_14_3_um_filter_63_12]